jgi:hypothetical protein
MGEFSGLQSFTNVQTRGFARHPGCSYSSQYFLLPWLSSRDFYIRTPHGSLPPRAPDMLTVRFGQLTARGLAPLKIHSLVGCSRFVFSVSACFRGSATRFPPYHSWTPGPHRTGQADFPYIRLLGALFSKPPLYDTGSGFCGFLV